MARAKVFFNIDGLDYYISKLDSMGKNISKVTEKALIESKKTVNEKLIRDTIKPNFPKEGNYSVGDTYKSIDRDYTVYWEDNTAYVKIGYDFKISGLKSIFLMYGARRKIHDIKAVKVLYNDIYSPRTMKEIAKIQEEILKREILEG